MSAAVAGARPAVVEALHVSKRWGDLEAVRDLTFTVARGEVVGLLGPNGAGKTTTMRMLTGFLPPTDGRIRIAGHDVFEEARRARAAIGYLPETPPLYAEMTVRGYLQFVAAIKDVRRAARRVPPQTPSRRVGSTHADLQSGSASGSSVSGPGAHGLDPAGDQGRPLRRLATG